MLDEGVEVPERYEPLPVSAGRRSSVTYTVGPVSVGGTAECAESDDCAELKDLVGPDKDELVDESDMMVEELFHP